MDEEQTNRFLKKTAVALSYEPSQEAPKIIASGHGYVADKIIKKAKENEVPLHTDSKLADTLSKLSVGDYIPEELYQVVAEVLLFVDRMDNIKKKVMGEQK